MVRMRARNGIAGTPLRSGKTGSLKQGLASNARPFIRPSIAASLDSVRSSARPNPAANRELITRPDSVLSVERRLLSAGSLTRHVAPVHVLTVTEAGRADTYAIHVAEHHEYYANGILVKNCYDAARYALMGARGRRVLKVL